MATATRKNRKPVKRRDVRATFLITGEQRDALDEHSERTSITMSHVIRGLLDEWMRRERR